MDAASAYLQAGGIDRLLLLMMPKVNPPPGTLPGEARVARGSIYGTLDAGQFWYVHFKKTVKEKYKMCESALEEGLYIYEVNGVTTFVAITHVDDLVIAYDRRCSTTAKLLEDLVKVFRMSHNDKDFIFCGRRVQGKDTEIIVSLEDASKSLELLDFASRRAEPSTPLLRGEHTAFRSLLGQLQWLQIQTRPELSFDVNKCAQRSAAPTIEDARYIIAVARRARDSPKAHLRYVRGLIDIPTCTLLSYGDAAFYKNMEREKSQYGVIIFATHRPKEFKDNSSSAHCLFGLLPPSSALCVAHWPPRAMQFPKPSRRRSGSDMYCARLGQVPSSVCPDRSGRSRPCPSSERSSRSRIV